MIMSFFCTFSVFKIRIIFNLNNNSLTKMNKIASYLWQLWFCFLDISFSLQDGCWVNGVSSYMCVGHGLGCGLDNWGSNNWGGSSIWVAVWVSSISTEVVISEWVISIRSSSVRS